MNPSSAELLSTHVSRTVPVAVPGDPLRVGARTATTPNVFESLPSDVVTVTVRDERFAVAWMPNDTVSVVAFEPAWIPGAGEIPFPETATVVVPYIRSVPEIVSRTVVPRSPSAGEIDVIRGGAGGEG